jgi:MFS family permease
MDARNETAGISASSLYHGWLVVAFAFLVALFSWGLGFYGLGIYLVALRASFGWSAADIATAITVYYILGAVLTFLFVGSAFDRYGVRRVVAAGAFAMGAAVAALPLASELWHVHAVFALMSIGWATMSGAAVNIIVAPWFERRRGFAMSLALNGASAGGLVMAPLLVFLIDRFGFAMALRLAAVLMLAVLLPLLGLVAREKRPGEYDKEDSLAAANVTPLAEQAAPPWDTRKVLRDPNFITISMPFALGLTAQVGFLTHQVAFLTPMTGTLTAAWIVSLTSFAAILGRLGTGLFVDRVDRRLVSCLNFLLQAGAMGILMTTSAPALIIGCVLFGLGLGNLVSLPALIVQQEFPNRDFARIVSMVVAINQFAFAFGPALLGRLQRPDGAYTYALLACLFMEVLGAVIVLAPVIGRMRRSHQAVYSGRRDPR